MLLLALLFWSGSSCSSSPGRDQAGGESHVGNLLLDCSAGASCAGSTVAGLECECFVCTAPCKDDASCRNAFHNAPSELLEHLICRTRPLQCAPDESDPAPPDGENICDVACAADDDCLVYGTSFRCVGSYCRQRSVQFAKLQTSLGCPAGMVLIRGKPDGSVDDLCFDSHEVTVASYAVCADAGACTPATKGNAFRDATQAYPIDWVAPDAAQRYCAYHGARMPRRQEWEWAAGNGSVLTLYPWGDHVPSSADDPPRVCALGASESCAVGSRPSGDTSSGLSDLSGNLAELVVDGADFCAAGGSYRVTDNDVAAMNGALRNDGCDPFVEPSAEIGFRCVTEAR